MPIFQRKADIVEAQQFLGADEPLPKGVKYSRLLGYYVETIHGHRLPILDGQWIVPEKDGIHYYPVTDEIFKQTWLTPLTQLQRFKELLTEFGITFQEEKFKTNDLCDEQCIKIITTDHETNLHDYIGVFVFNLEGKYLKSYYTA